MIKYGLSISDIENIKKAVGLDESFLTSIEQVMLLASDDIMRVYKGDIKVESKDNSSPVTIADKKASETITSYLDVHFGIPAVSEENIEDFNADDLDGKVYFLIDPIDGTKHFIKKDDEFSINIALMFGGVVVCGFVYMPALDVLYYSLPGDGAYKVENVNDFGSKPVRIFANTFGKGNEELNVISGGSTKNNTFTKSFLESLGKEVKVNLSQHGSSYKMCLIAEGKQDVYPRFGGTCEWDTAAPFAILKEAGGSIITLPQEEEMTFLNKYPDWENRYFIAIGDTDKDWICSHSTVSTDECRIKLRQEGKLKAYQNI